MTESPFVTVHNVVAAETNVADDLRILAKDKPGLKPQDRDIMIRAADELEYAQRVVATLYAAVTERDQALQALKDQSAALRQKVGALTMLQPFDSMGAVIRGNA